MIPDGWSQSKIGDIANIYVGRDLRESAYSDEPTKEYQYPVYSNTVENRGLYGFYNFPEYDGDYVTVVGRGIGLGTAFARKNEKFGAIGRLLVLAPKQSAFDPVFLAEFINKRVHIFNESGGIPQLPGSSLATYEVIIPPLSEQRHIAEITECWNQAIEATEKLIANSQAQKKALIQQLLSGRKRLPGFSQKWSKSTLGSLFEFKKGQGLSKNAVTEYGKKPCILYGELYTRYPEVIRNIVSRTNADSGVPSKAGDILIPASTTTTGADLANATAVLEDDVLLSGDINILRPKRPKQSAPFFAYLLTHILKDKIASCAQGITIIHLYGSHLKPLTVFIPRADEQHAIAEVIMSADSEIVALKSQLEVLRKEKAALMQQLLTGKRRVKIEETAGA